MRRLLLLPVGLSVLACEVWRRGFIWPIATQVYSVLAPRPITANDEADIFA